MIITIAIVSLVVFALAWHIGSRIYQHKKGIYCSDDDEPFMIAFTFLGILPVMVCSFLCIFANSRVLVQSKEYELQEKIKLFENDKRIIESYHPIAEQNSDKLTSDITFEVISTSEYYKKVSEYNTNVYDFKVDVKTHQFRRQNAWISWFFNKGWLSVNDETLNNLTYTVGK